MATTVADLSDADLARVTLRLAERLTLEGQTGILHVRLVREVLAVGDGKHHHADVCEVLAASSRGRRAAVRQVSVWLRAGTRQRSDREARLDLDLYVITPEALATPS